VRFWRFKQLQERGIFANRMAARRAVMRGAIDPPIELSPNVIAWTDEAVERYLARCPHRIPSAPGTGKVVGQKASVMEGHDNP
jgi:hypothetical protein